MVAHIPMVLSHELNVLVEKLCYGLEFLGVRGCLEWGIVLEGLEMTTLQL